MSAGAQIHLTLLGSDEFTEAAASTATGDPLWTVGRVRRS